MTIDITDQPRRVQYVGSGTGPYDFDFECLEQTDIAVYQDDTLLTLTTHYTVSLNADGTGSVTTIASMTGSTVTIVGARPYERITDYSTGGDFFAESVNDELDSFTILLQQLRETLTRTLKLPTTSTLSGDAVFPDPEASKVIAWNSTATGLQNVSLLSSGILTVSSFIETVLDDSSANAVLTTLTATRSETGAVAVPVLNKLREIISVKDFGAVGDGVTDDTAAITAANNSTFTAIYLPHGTYITTLTTLSINKTYFGPGTISLNGTLASPAGAWIKWNGATGGGTTMPYLLSAYHLANGRFATGVDVIVSNKRVDVAGAIQGCNALANGSEPAMVDISPDVNGPALRLEGRSTLTGGQDNVTALAVYDMDAIIGGATSYSAGYGTKKFAINGKGDMYWGSNLSNAPESNFEWKFSVNPSGPIITGGTGASVTLQLKAAAGAFSSDLVLDSGATGVQSIDWKANGTRKLLIYRTTAAQLTFNNGTSDHFIIEDTGAVIALKALAIPAGGTTGHGYKFSSTANFGLFFGSGAPTLSAAKGSLYLRSDGTTTNDRAYINTNGTTTWTALTTAA